MLRAPCSVQRRETPAASQPSSPRENAEGEAWKERPTLQADRRLRTHFEQPSVVPLPLPLFLVLQPLLRAQHGSGCRAAGRSPRGSAMASPQRAARGGRGAEDETWSRHAPIRSTERVHGTGAWLVPLAAGKRLLFVFLLKLLSCLPLLGDPLMKPLGGLWHKRNKRASALTLDPLCSASAAGPVWLLPSGLRLSL